MKKTLSIFIPAYNEEKNIKKLLKSILNQEGYFTLEKILIISDASNDNTVSEIHSLNNPLIEVIENEKRMGKWFGFTIAQKKLLSEIIISIDADTEIIHGNFLELLTDSLEKADISSPKILPKKPRGLLQKILNCGAAYTLELFEKNIPKTNFYLCHGRCIATKKNCFLSINWQKTFGTDAYIYFSVISKGFIFSYSNQAKIYYILPKKITDYKSQSNRATEVLKLMEAFFGKEEVIKNTKIDKLQIIKIIIKYTCLHPIIFPSYILIKIVTQLKKNKTNHIWHIAESTK